MPFKVDIDASTVLLDVRRRVVKGANVTFRVTGTTAVQRLGLFMSTRQVCGYFQQTWRPKRHCSSRSSLGLQNSKSP